MKARSMSHGLKVGQKAQTNDNYIQKQVVELLAKYSCYEMKRLYHIKTYDVLDIHILQQLVIKPFQACDSRLSPNCIFYIAIQLARKGEKVYKDHGERSQSTNTLNTVLQTVSVVQFFRSQIAVIGVLNRNQKCVQAQKGCI